MSRISQQQLESYLWGAATLLRGTIDAGDYKQFIFPLLFHKRLCDVFDEETQAALKESGGDVEFAQYPDGPWRHARRWSSPRSNGWTGSTGGGSSSRSATYRRRSVNSGTIRRRKLPSWWPKSTNELSGNPGAVHNP